MAVTPLDFTKPTRLSADWHNRLTAWGRLALTLANKSWSKELPAPLEASVGEVELCYAWQMSARLSDETLSYRINLGERLATVLVMPRALMLNLVGTLLGDNATAANDHDLTLIEEKLGEYFLLHHWLAFFRESWPGASAASWTLEGRDTNLACSRIFPETEVLLAIHWQLRGGWGETKGAWYFPRKGLIDLLGGPTVSTPDAIPEAQIAVRREAIVHQLALIVEVVLGSVELRLSELSSLRVGDVVLLDKRASDAVLARAGGQDLFRGRAGKVGAWKAFQIESNVKK